MNRQRFGSAVGIGLMFVAMLSMIAMPALASAEERATARHEWTFYCHCGRNVTVWVEGYYTSSGFTGGNRGWSSNGINKVSFDYVSHSGIEWAQFIGKCLCGRNVEVTVWVSPPTITSDWRGHSGKCY